MIDLDDYGSTYDEGCDDTMDWCIEILELSKKLEKEGFPLHQTIEILENKLKELDAKEVKEE